MTASLDQIQWGFSSLGAPELSLKELSDLVRKFKLDFLEVRAVSSTVKLPDYFRDHPELLNTATVPIRVGGTGLSLAGAEDKDFEEFIRFAGLAKAWNAPYLRVFGGGKWGDEVSSEILAKVAKAIDRSPNTASPAKSSSKPTTLSPLEKTAVNSTINSINPSACSGIPTTPGNSRKSRLNKPGRKSVRW